MASTKVITLSNGFKVIQAKESENAIPIRTDVFSDFSLPSLVRPIISKDRMDLLSILCPVAELRSVFEKLKNKGFILRIPEEFRQAIREGTAYLGSSGKHPGGMTPNIHDAATGKTIGQGYIQSVVDPSSMGSIMNNLAVFAMLQSIIVKLDDLQETVTLIKEGQKDDRLGKIIGSFKSYVIALPTFNSIEEQRNASFIVYCSISEGLYQIHFFLDRVCQLMQDSPDNWWKHLLVAIKHPFKNVAEQKEAVYHELLANLYNYYNLIILSDIILLHRGASFSVIKENHKSINAFYHRALGGDLDAKVDFLCAGNSEDYQRIKQLTMDEEGLLQRAILSLDNPTGPLEIKFEEEEIKQYLQYGR